MSALTIALALVVVPNASAKKRVAAPVPELTREDPVIIRAYPRMPEGSEMFRSFVVLCDAVMRIDREGVPYDVQVHGCPSDFREKARDAAWQWLFQPAEIVEGKAELSAWQLSFSFSRFASSNPFEEVVVTEPERIETEQPGDVPVVPYSELTATRVSRPVYPESLMRFYENKGLVHGECRVRIVIDEGGRPTDIRPEGCPEMMFEPVYRSFLAWSFVPIEIDGKASRVQFVAREVLNPYE